MFKFTDVTASHVLEALCLQLLPTAYVGNSLDKLRHTRSVAYSV